MLEIRHQTAKNKQTVCEKIKKQYSIKEQNNKKHSKNKKAITKTAITLKNIYIILNKAVAFLTQCYINSVSYR